MTNGFSYRIDYAKEIEHDRAALADCDRCDRVNALVPVLATLGPLGWQIQDLLSCCADLEFASKVAEALGVSLEILAASGTDTEEPTYWALAEAFEAREGRAPRTRDFKAWYLFQVMTPAQTKAARTKAKASLSRHLRNQARFG